MADLDSVSILTDSWESVQQTRSPSLWIGQTVSILTDSWESVQRLPRTDRRIASARFQSSPTPGSRCNVCLVPIGG